MSVIVTDPDGRYFIFTKGADNVILPKVTLNPEILDMNKQHLVDFAKQGLRTLVLAYREITIEELTDWEKKYNVFNMNNWRMLY